MTVAEVLDYLRLTDRFALACLQVRERRVAADAARARGIEISEMACEAWLSKKLA